MQLGYSLSVGRGLAGLVAHNARRREPRRTPEFAYPFIGPLSTRKCHALERSWASSNVLAMALSPGQSGSIGAVFRDVIKTHFAPLGFDLAKSALL